MTRNPPRLARALLRVLITEPDRAFLLDDLDEEFALLTRDHGEHAAKRRYWSQSLRSLPALAARRLRLARRRIMSFSGGTVYASIGADLRQAVRSALRAPVASLTVIVTLGLGLGVTTAIFSVIHAVMLRPLPYADPGALVKLQELVPAWNPLPSQMAVADYEAYRASPVVQGAGAYRFGGATYTDDRGAVALSGLVVTPSLLGVLGVRPAAGRFFTDLDVAPGAAPAIVITNRLWQGLLGGDSAVVGKSVTINARPRLVIGVLPADFRAPAGDPDLLLPLDYRAVLADVNRAHKFHWLDVIARLKPGVSLEQARSALTVVSSRMTSEFPESNTGHFAAATPLRDAMVGSAARPLWIAFASAAFVLLIACANVANVMLARTISRRKEVAVRAALGATRARLAALMVAEGTVLAVIGGGVGAALALFGVRPLLAVVSPAGIPMREIRVDSATIVFGFVLSVVVGVLAGAIPALFASDTRLNETLAKQGRGSHRGIARQLRAGFVSAQLALAMILLVGAGLMLRTLVRLGDVSVGFDRENVVTFALGLPGAKYKNDTLINAFYDDLQKRLAALPGVRGAAMAGNLPLQGKSTASLAVAGSPDLKIPSVGYIPVSRDYFRTLGIPMRMGREFSDIDVMGGPNVVVVSQSLAKQLWPTSDAIGQRIVLGPNPNDPPFTIIGVVGDVRQDGPAIVPPPIAYPYMRQDVSSGAFVIVKGSGQDAALMDALRRVVKELDPALPLQSLSSMTDVAKTAIATQRFSLMLLAAFGGIAVALAAIGVYGVIAYTVTTRMHEFGIRLALGAQRRDVSRLVLLHGMRPVVIGVVAGVLGAALITRFMTAMLYEVQAIDPPTFAAVAVLLVAIALVASYLPARAAARADPLTSIREE